jgi:hypothetical protein
MTNVDRIRREIASLSASERRELLEWLRSEGAAHEAADDAERERAFRERMLEEGFLTSISTRTPQNDFAPIVVRGKPASETLIEDREPR